VTGLWNRDSFLCLSEKEFQREKRIGSMGHLLYFERMPLPSERMGRGGESAEDGIRDLAHECRNLCAPDDLIGRMADQIFALLLVNTCLAGAMDVARSICAIPNQINEQRTVARDVGGISASLTCWCEPRTRITWQRRRTPIRSIRCWTQEPAR
jgi:GGDEF domain-containing protein